MSLAAADPRSGAGIGPYSGFKKRSRAFLLLDEELRQLM
jgi:hypothetical protein